MFSTSPLLGRELSQRQLAEIVKRQTSSLREGGADRSLSWEGHLQCCLRGTHNPLSAREMPSSYFSPQMATPRLGSLQIC